MPHPVFVRRPDKIYLHNYHLKRGLCCALGAQQHRGPEPQCAPRNALHPTHLQPPRTGLGGGGDESDTVPAHQEPAVCGRGQHTHKLLGSPAAGGQTEDTGRRGSLGRGGLGSYFSINVRVQNEAKEVALLGHLAAPALLPAPRPRRALRAPPSSLLLASGSQQPSLLQDLHPL